ncbi:hypothetical protein Ssi03_67380 [Sphaerisporangium siamense]|uniref:DUF2306 domain-containing protein n=1 Tax=Sphaerisporangium siamense TaxID=795645 RepID=A0A7W7GB63_9ACTN|nr:DUF2306 domain-containing protein [Sphaerisporangium siamense]MBB4704753.1 hypothetical protein [Sphaerisporangium siamense]GII88748.1 hypothetical protein Ssi03_67380 [Sphaerisporangium siamense]
MTQLHDLSTPQGRTGERENPGTELHRPRGRTRRRPGDFAPLPLAILTIVFLAFQIPKYSALDPARAQRPVESAAHYWLIAAHVATGTLALVTVVVQIWPWLRRRHPAVHRWAGRVYVFAGAIPSALLVLVMLPVSSPVGKVGSAMAAVLWASTALIGWVALRRRRYAEHRRWMIYSFAVVWGGPVWAFFVGMSWLWWSPWAEQVDFDHVLDTISWAGWIINLIIAQWWIEHTSGRRLTLPPREIPTSGARGH